MAHSKLTTFGATFAVAIVLAFALGAVLTPPDPFTQLLFVAVGAPVALLASHVLVYRGGFDALRSRFAT